MPAIDTPQTLRRTDEYWNLVREVFQGPLNQPSTTPIDDLEREMARATELEQLLFYHREPLDVAAAVAGVDVTGMILNDYRPLAQSRRWYPLP